GNILTERRDGFTIDAGPDSFVRAKPHAERLCRDLGLGDRLIETLEPNRKVYVLRHGRLIELPRALVLGVPSRIRPLLATPLLSWKGKARALAEALIPAQAGEGDMSAAAFFERRFGREMLD